MGSQHTTEQVKDLRKQIDAIIQRVESEFERSRELALVRTKLEEAKMWAGKELGNLGNELPAEFADKADGPAQPTTETTPTLQHIVDNPSEAAQPPASSDVVAPGSPQPEASGPTTPAGDPVDHPAEVTVEALDPEPTA